MQGNDLGQQFGKRIVVVLEPLLMAPPAMSFTERWGRVRNTPKFWDKFSEQWTLNDKMCHWIRWHGRELSVGAEVWSFLPDEELFDRLQLRVDQICEDYILEWTLWTNIHDAYIRLQSSPDIVGVYDADRDRTERYWHYRGVSVPPGECP